MHLRNGSLIGLHPACPRACRSLQSAASKELASFMNLKGPGERRLAKRVSSPCVSILSIFLTSFLFCFSKRLRKNDNTQVVKRERAGLAFGLITTVWFARAMKMI